jgi:type II restriction enzyme
MKKDHRKEVLALWKLRSKAEQKARKGGNTDPGLRAGVTSGRHLDPLSELVRSIFIDAGIPAENVHCGSKDLEIPGFYRPQKKWDVVVVHNGVLVAAVEFKSILGSYGNNMNNRTEESLGNAIDLLEAAEQGLIGTRPPWLGFVFFMQDDERSRKGGKNIKQPHFTIDPAFAGATYQGRAAIWLRRLLMKRLYNAAWYALVDPAQGVEGVREPDPDLSWAKFEAAIRGRVGEVLA